jgi:hypothetical protein
MAESAERHIFDGWRLLSRRVQRRPSTAIVRQRLFTIYIWETYCILASCDICFTLNICSFVHQCNTFNFYFLLIIDMFLSNNVLLSFVHWWTKQQILFCLLSFVHWWRKEQIFFCSLVHQCNTFNFYFLLIVEMFRPHTTIFRCYSILSRSTPEDGRNMSTNNRKIKIEMWHIDGEKNRCWETYCGTDSCSFRTRSDSQKWNLRSILQVKFMIEKLRNSMVCTFLKEGE